MAELLVAFAGGGGRAACALADRLPPLRWAEIGPVLFSNTSPSYMQLQPVQGGDEGGGLSTAAIIALALGALALVGGAAWLVTRRRSTAGERE